MGRAGRESSDQIFMTAYKTQYAPGHQVRVIELSAPRADLKIDGSKSEHRILVTERGQVSVYSQ